MHRHGYVFGIGDAVCAVCELECDDGLGSGDGTWDARFSEAAAAK